MEKLLLEIKQAINWFYKNNDEKIFYNTLINLCKKEIIGYDGVHWWNLSVAIDKTLMKYSSDISRNEEYCKLSYIEKDYSQRQEWTNWFSSVNDFNSDDAKKLKLTTEAILNKIPVKPNIYSKEKLYWNTNKKDLGILEIKLKEIVKNIINLPE